MREGHKPFMQHIRSGATAAVLAAASLACATATAGSGSSPALADTPVDLARYAGTWHEIARIPMYFQNRCARDVTATYTRDGDYIRVLNRCVKKDGDAITAEGRARVTDAPVNRKLKVGFAHIFDWWLFEGDYWILDLDPDYRWVIVGHPDRKYGWILARTTTIDAALRSRLDQRLRDFGYDPARFIESNGR